MLCFTEQSCLLLIVLLHVLKAKKPLESKVNALKYVLWALWVMQFVSGSVVTSSSLREYTVVSENGGSETFSYMLQQKCEFP